MSLGQGRYVVGTRWEMGRLKNYIAEKQCIKKKNSQNEKKTWRDMIFK
jgi:hypothetical protein